MNKMREDLVSAREQMKRDSLTGVFNRRAFDTGIIHSLNLNFILDQPITVILIDLDYFKEVNDTYGHPGGDAVLRTFGDLLSRTFVRKNDIVARFGGDEFAVILSDTTAEITGMLLERFHERLKETRLPDVSDELRISCSTGYTAIAPGDTVDELLKRVDSALYVAKKAGRGRCHFAPPPEPAELMLAEA
ncbi:MAG: GGDEF domain-containing protein [Woeseia sp.]|nr:GGDEF domain-containing protein [Woeseia sp.]